MRKKGQSGRKAGRRLKDRRTARFAKITKGKYEALCLSIQEAFVVYILQVSHYIHILRYYCSKHQFVTCVLLKKMFPIFINITVKDGLTWTFQICNLILFKTKCWMVFGNGEIASEQFNYTSTRSMAAQEILTYISHGHWREMMLLCVAAGCNVCVGNGEE